MTMPNDPNPGWTDPATSGPPPAQPGWSTPPPPPPAPGTQGWPPPAPPAAAGWAPPGAAYGYGYGGAQEHPKGTTILILGICGLVVCGLLAPVAWTMGNTALKEIDANPGAYTNRGSVNAGRICGIIGTCFIALWVVFVILAVVLGAFGAASSSN